MLIKLLLFNKPRFLLQDSEGHDRICYKKVAVVEDFFEIVYNLHVCKEGKEHKHMGQKRTYRAVSIQIRLNILGLFDINQCNGRPTFC